MAIDKLVDSTQLDSDLTSVANAIRAKTGGSADLLFPSQFVQAVNSIPIFNQNITIKLKNSLGASLSIRYAVYSSANIITGVNATLANAAENNYLLLAQNGKIGLNINLAVTSVTYNSENLSFTQTGSGTTRPISITLPENYSNTIPIILS